MKIMVGFDGSNVAKDALKLAETHAKAFNAEIEIVTSLIKGTENQIKDIAKAERELEEAKNLCQAEGFECKTHLLIRGLSPGEDLIQFAKENAVDEIIVGVKRRSKVGKLVFGSTAQYVILESPCPVVTVK
jgi:nucleotide-binding universal stress UspA family protein